MSIAPHGIAARWCAAAVVAIGCGPFVDASTTSSSSGETTGLQVDPSVTETATAGSNDDADGTSSLPMDDGSSSSSGGELCAGDPLAPDPDAPACATDRVGTWTTMSSIGSPSAIYGATMVWTGSAAIVWGGGTDPDDAGGLYDPSADAWSPITSAGAPPWRINHSAVWTGSEMFVWGGVAESRVDLLRDGGRYRPDTDTWTAITTRGAPAPRAFAPAVWTGSEMLVFGGVDHGTRLQDGARYDPAFDRWQPMASPAFDVGSQVALWTGGQLLVWGGSAYDAGPLPGGRYDPVSDDWQPMTMVGAPSFIDGPIGVWTGSRAIFYGGCCVDDAFPRNRAAAYDPTTDTWGPEVVLCDDWPSHAVAVWTGCDLLVWLSASIASDEPAPLDVFRFDGNTVWQSSPGGEPSARTGALAVWTGDAMIVWGGAADDGFASGAIYRP